MGVDRVIEVAAATNMGLDLEVIRRGGLIVAYGSDAAYVSIPFFPAILNNIHVQFFIVYNLDDDERARAIAGVTELLESGSLEPRIGAQFPLEQVADAHEVVESGEAAGNVLLRLDE